MEPGERGMKRCAFFLTIAGLVVLFAGTALASSAISIQWGDNSKPQSNAGL